MNDCPPSDGFVPSCMDRVVSRETPGNENDCCFSLSLRNTGEASFPSDGDRRADTKIVASKVAGTIFVKRS